MKIPVVKRYSKKEFDIIYLDTSDILFSRSFRGEIYYQTKDELYARVSTFEEHERFLELEGFKKVDRCYLVQMEKVELFDTERHRLYFEKQPVGKDAPSAPVSTAHRAEITSVQMTSDAYSEGARHRLNTSSNMSKI
ncbi:hypothetical protein EBB07_32850 [Paenibacillaceae bacterium]|nr:hypothetical protein EBB07_32850 [Paenibacillaceae bacterium]